MALYKNPNLLTRLDDAAFERVYSVGETPMHSGIYRCEGCGREVVAEESRVLPTQNHHQHTSTQGAIRWRLIVFADHRAKG